MANVVTIHAQHGFDAPNERNPHKAPSAEYMAFAAGACMSRCGYTRPTEARMGRGYVVRVWTAANEFKATFDARMAVRVERLP